jgi:nucleoid DNA-binding protein
MVCTFAVEKGAMVNVRNGSRVNGSPALLLNLRKVQRGHRQTANFALLTQSNKSTFFTTRLHAIMKFDDFLTLVSNDTGIPRERVRRVIKSFASSIRYALRRGDSISWDGLGTIFVAKRAAHYYRDPNTQVLKRAPAQNLVKWRSKCDLST